MDDIDYYIDILDEKYSMFYWDSEDPVAKTGVFISKRDVWAKNNQKITHAVDGIVHRIDGPAVEWTKNIGFPPDWYCDGVFYNSHIEMAADLENSMTEEERTLLLLKYA